VYVSYYTINMGMGWNIIYGVSGFRSKNTGAGDMADVSHDPLSANGQADALALKNTYHAAVYIISKT
jgi:hypothetical protein